MAKVLFITNIYVWGDSAYVTVLGRTREGVFLPEGSMTHVAIDPEAIAGALDEVRRRGNPLVKLSNNRVPSPVEKVIGLRGSKKMAIAGVMCAVVAWYDVKVAVAFSKVASKDLDLIDYREQREFPLDVTTSEIGECIVEEWIRRQGAGQFDSRRQVK